MSSNESNQNYIANSVVVNLNMLDALIKDEVIHNEDGNLIVTIHL